MTSEVIRSL